MEQKKVFERKIHAKPHPEKYRLSNNRKRTKGRIKMGTTIQNVSVYETRTEGNIVPIGRLLGYHYVYHQNNI